jgi:hypothetical protein
MACCHPQYKPKFTTAYKYERHLHGCKVAGPVSGDGEASNLLVFWCVVFCRWVLFSMFRKVLELPFSWVKQYKKNELYTSGTPCRTTQALIPTASNPQDPAVPEVTWFL